MNGSTGIGQAASTHGSQGIIAQYQFSKPEKQNMNLNFELLEHTIITLARFFRIEETSKGIDRLMRLLYKIKGKIEN